MATGHVLDQEALSSYRSFVIARHAAYAARREGLERPWTSNLIVQTKKFTNVFRVLDHGSQFVVGELLNSRSEDLSAADTLLRAWMYRYTNRPEPWEYYYAVHGRYPTVADMADDTVSETWQEYAERNPMFGTAYTMFSGAENKGTRRIDWLLDLTHRVFVQEEWFDAEEFVNATPAERHVILMRVPRCAEFMAMQILTDYHYSNEYGGDYENRFVAAGPGARVGASHLTTSGKPNFVIDFLYRYWDGDDEAPMLSLPSGKERGLSKMDIQNTLCEFGKYRRYQKNQKPGRVYRPAHDNQIPEPVLPAHWDH